MAKDQEGQEIIRDILRYYAAGGDPGIIKDGEDITRKEFAGEPMTAERSKVRSQCKPQGPVGHLLEAIHMQGACLDREMKIHQWGQPPIDIVGAPMQHVAPLIRQMCARNRTAAAQGQREETRDLG